MKGIKYRITHEKQRIDVQDQLQNNSMLTAVTACGGVASYMGWDEVLLNVTCKVTRAAIPYISAPSSVALLVGEMIEAN